MVQIYHPETGGLVDVPDVSVHHHMRAGWMPLSDWIEHTERLARLEDEAQRQAPAPVVPVTPAARKPAQTKE